MAILERERELATIDSMVENVGHGEGGGLLVHGHAGIGKTTLIGAAVDRAHAAGLRVLSPAEASSSSPLRSGWSASSTTRFFAHRPSVGGRVCSRGRRGLSAPVFGLPVDDRMVPAPGDPQEAALLGLFWLTSDLAYRQAMLIALDDLQWADAASLAWLAYTLRRLADVPVAVIAAARTGRTSSSAASPLRAPASSLSPFPRSAMTV